MKGEFPKRVKCVTCGHTPDLLELINRGIGTSYQEPDFEMYGYRFWFRDYLATGNNTAFVGLALAWPVPMNGEGDERYFYAMAGNDMVGEYKKGHQFDISVWPPTESWGMEDFRRGKKDAMQRLLWYVGDLQK